MTRLLKIDLDIKPPKDWLSFWLISRLEMLKNLGHESEDCRMFNTSRGMHVYFRLADEVSDKTANMLQFLLGDDHTRVKINQWRIERGIKRWNKLFHRVIYRKRAKILTCYYCGNKIPLRD